MLSTRQRTDSSYWSAEEGDAENTTKSASPKASAASDTSSTMEMQMDTTLEDKIPELIPLLKSWRHPSVQWSQSGDNLKLTVQLRGLNAVELKCSSTSIFFSTELEDVTYKFGFKFYDAIVPSQCRCQIHESCFVIKFVKMTGGEWPRLTESTLKHHYIQPDLDVMYCEDTGGASSTFMSPSTLLSAVLIPEHVESKAVCSSEMVVEDEDEDQELTADDVIARLQEEVTDDSGDESGSFNMLL